MQNKYPIILIVLALLILGAGIWFAQTNKDQTPEKEQTKSNQETMPQEEQQPTETAQEPVAQNGECVRTFDPKNVPTTVDIKNKFVTLTVKDFGDIKLQLFDADAPKTVENFLKLTQAGFYNCLSFHRIAPGFVIQGGDPKGDGTGGPGYTVPAEIKRNHVRGSLATARLGGPSNPEKDSSGSQFYIALKDLPELDGDYTVYGQVVAGMEVVDKIAQVKLQPGLGNSSPVVPVIITNAVISDK